MKGRDENTLGVPVRSRKKIRSYNPTIWENPDEFKEKEIEVKVQDIPDLEKKCCVIS